MITIPMKPYYNKLWQYAYDTRHSHGVEDISSWVLQEYPNATVNDFLYSRDMMITFNNELDATAFILRWA
jgi:hypothetical protein